MIVSGVRRMCHYRQPAIARIGGPVAPSAYGFAVGFGCAGNGLPKLVPAIGLRTL